ncbi:carboxylesterase family protein [Microbacterium sp. C448]|uniref:carboxylesterase family protein n=1 Tax=Microbacterium sp. C448 TaxID=1177594 RepID=UPI0009DD2169|nr:carboxylesterase family protein [Microbacterium sp. C448]
MTADPTSGPLFAPPCGPVRGWMDGPVTRATDIPYASAERFAEPSVVPDWSEPFDATDWSPACPQRAMPFLDRVLGSTLDQRRLDEDCQHLSVTMPAGTAPGDDLPVMVWIHGGSYVSGAGDLPIMDPAALVAEQNVIVVTVTYRLGLFGFLGGVPGRPANLGLLDQLAAFAWVQRNISAFGGDPRRVTAFGQSAGGDAVAHLMATSGAAGLFTRAIIQSAPLGLARGRSEMSAAMNDVFGEALAGVAPDAPAADILAMQPAVDTAASRFGLKSGMAFGTQYGHEPLPAEAELDEAWDAAAPSIDILIGHTAEEAALFLPRLQSLQGVLRVPVLGKLVGRTVVSLVTRLVYSRDSRKFARRHARAGGRAHHYVISWSAPKSGWGSAHTVDLPLLFGDADAWRAAALVTGTPWADIDASGRQVRAVWGRFARGEDLGERVTVPRALDVRRIR